MIIPTCLTFPTIFYASDLALAVFTCIEERSNFKVKKTSEGNSRKFKIIGLGAAALVLAAAIVLAVIMLSNPHLAVPGKYRTIQLAIDAAKDGDVIIVQPGVYYEQIDFLGKNITVQSINPR